MFCWYIVLEIWQTSSKSTSTEHTPTFKSMTSLNVISEKNPFKLKISVVYSASIYWLVTVYLCLLRTSSMSNLPHSCHTYMAWQCCTANSKPLKSMKRKWFRICQQWFKVWHIRVQTFFLSFLSLWCDRGCRVTVSAEASITRPQCVQCVCVCKCCAALSRDRHVMCMSSVVCL